MTLRFETLTGAGIGAAIDGLAHLRITVFRDWPYLYDGDLDYERSYLRTYEDSPEALIVAAYDGAELVGASTGLPLEQAEPEFAAAFQSTPHKPERIFYCAESVLLPGYRGQGAGHRFFDLREAHAQSLGLAQSAFCSVMRPVDHPAHPEDYQPLDSFWRKRGYAPVEGAIARFHWRDLGDAEETEKSLQFWIRDL